MVLVFEGWKGLKCSFALIHVSQANQVSQAGLAPACGAQPGTQRAASLVPKVCVCACRSRQARVVQSGCQPRELRSLARPFTLHLVVLLNTQAAIEMKPAAGSGGLKQSQYEIFTLTTWLLRVRDLPCA